MPNKKIDYHNYSHNSPSITTMGEFVSESDSLGIGLDIAQLLIYEDEFGRKNIDKLDDLYTVEEHNKYSSLLDQIRSTKPQQEQKTTNPISPTSDSISIEPNKSIDTSNSIIPLNQAALNTALKTPGVESAYLNYSYFSNLSKLDSLYSIEVKLLFKKFIYRIETETPYYVKITSAKRNIQEQRSEILKGNKKASLGFSYHLPGLAIDINLILKSGVNPLMSSLTSLNDKEEWELTGVPKIARDLRLRWGDDFDVIDLIHFDARNYYKIDTQKFLSSIQNGVSNNLSNVSEIQSPNLSYSDLPLPLGTQFSLPISKVDRDVLSTETNQTVNTVDFESFLAKQLIDLMSSDKYKSTFTPKSKPFKGTLQEIYPHISVWIWSRALSISSEISTDGKIQYVHKIINVTPYVISLNTNNGNSGGNFSVSLAPITADLYNQAQTNSVLDKGWKIETGTNKGVSKKNGDYVNQGFMHYIENDELKRNRMYFDKVLQYNDVVFIKFEELELESKNRRSLDGLETISIHDLPNQVFDMIALIDDVQQDIQHANVDVNISVTGRDLIKLLIEDGVYFYPTEFTADGIFSNTGATNTRLKRFGSNGQYLNRFQAANKTVDRSLKFIINNLGSIEICPNSLFDGYQNAKLDITKDLSPENTVDKRSQAYQLTSDQVQQMSDQQNSSNDKISHILEKISKIQKSNNINSTPNVAYDIINNFLKNRIDNNEIISLNQKVNSWDYTDNNIRYKNILPSSLSDIFYVSEIVWTDERERGFLNFSNESIIIEKIDSMYSDADKVELGNSNLILFKLLSKNKKNNNGVLREDRYENTIPFSNITNELDIFLKQNEFSTQHIINQSDVDDLKNLYLKVEQVRGFGGMNGVINLNLLSKNLNDLTDDQKGVVDDIYNIIIEQSSIKKQPINQQSSPLAGIWQIIKLIVDDSVKDRRLTDSSIGNENGSILNAFRKICQDPFCEFYTDTYGDQFYFIARKKPFDKESILSILNGRAKYEKIDSNVSQFDKFGSIPPNINSQSIVKQNLIIDIDDKDIISESIKYSTEAYSWYKLQLNNLTSGSSSDLAFAYLKAIYFDEYADIFGSKPLDLSTSYIPYSPIIDKNKKLPTAYFIKQGVYDLKYMIESHAHLPFTRTGNLVMNGERRIKKGNFVRLKSTSEIFYVDSVSNSFSIADKNIDRTTSIQISRGMVERYINENDNDLGISYFNICDLPIDENVFNNVNTAYSDFSKASTSRWKVNRDIFNFFLKKLQFAKNDKEILST